MNKIKNKSQRKSENKKLLSNTFSISPFFYQEIKQEVEIVTKYIKQEIENKEGKH